MEESAIIAILYDEILREANFPSMTLHELPPEFHAGHARPGEVPGKEHSRIQRLWNISYTTRQHVTVQVQES